MDVKNKIIEEIRKIYDPELPVNIYELGLIYNIEVKEGAMQVEGIDEVDLELVWDPPWTKDMMSDAAKLELNL